jgi:hypothetical protein
MNFAKRYEFSASITTGAVETFPARDVISGERVLICVFENAAPQPANVPTIEWVLEAFSKVAPAPKEIVINAGRYSGTAFLYLVTKMPASDALNQWIEAYRGYGSRTHGFRAAPNEENRESRAPQPSGEQKKVGTSAFPALGSDLESVNSGPQRSAPSEAFGVQTGDPSGHRPTQSGTFTSLFLRRFNKSTEAPKAETGHEMNPDSPGRTRDPFTTAPDSLAGVPRERATGEFTSFFKGPFSGEASPDTPKNIQPAPKPEAMPGEFTRLFGRDEKTPHEAPPGPTPRIQADNLSLTEILSEPPRGRIDQQTPSPIVTPPTAFGPASVTSAHADAPRPVSSGQVTSPLGPVWQPEPAPPVPPPQAPPAPSAPPGGGYNQENATQLFSYSGSGRAGEPTLPAGPSEYTMVISRRSMPLAEPPLDPPVEGAAKPGFVPPVAMPHLPPPPRMPAMSPLPMPTMPPPPKLGQTPPEGKQVSYWPLILVMTVMFFLAVLLVMYFVLKH